MSDETLFDFPCRFPIKVMGRNVDDFQQVIVEIITRHSDDFDKTAITAKASKDSNFVSVTVTIVATSKSQLDAIYQDLSGHPNVLMTL
jgi:uncharacterized protein